VARLESSNLLRHFLLPLPFALLLVSAGLPGPTPVQAQEVVAPQITGPDFHASVITFLSDQASARTLVEVYISIAYEQLLFTRADGAFRAEYDLTLILVGPRGEQVFDETTREQTTTPVFEETLSDEIIRIQRFSFIVDPGTYDLEVSLNDQFRSNPKEISI